MTIIAKYRDLLSAGLSLAFVVFVLGSVAAKALTTGVFLHPALSPAPAASAAHPAAPPLQP
jgi:hypothetical protein